MATEIITTSGKPIAANISVARKQYVQALDTLATAAGQLENAADDASCIALSGVSNTALRDILVGIRDLLTTNNYDTVTKEWIVNRLYYFKTLRNQYE